MPKLSKDRQVPSAIRHFRETCLPPNHSSQKGFAELIGVHWRSVQQWELGKISVPENVVDRLSHEFGLAADSLSAPDGISRIFDGSEATKELIEAFRSLRVASGNHDKVLKMLHWQVNVVARAMIRSGGGISAIAEFGELFKSILKNPVIKKNAEAIILNQAATLEDQRVTVRNLGNLLANSPEWKRGDALPKWQTFSKKLHPDATVTVRETRIPCWVPQLGFLTVNGSKAAHYYASRETWQMLIIAEKRQITLDTVAISAECTARPKA